MSEVRGGSVTPERKQSVRVVKGRNNLRPAGKDCVKITDAKAREELEYLRRTLIGLLGRVNSALGRTTE